MTGSPVARPVFPASLPAQFAACLLVLAGLVACEPRAAAPPSSPDHSKSESAASPRQLSSEQLREDFDALYAGLRSAHVDLFERRSEAEYEALFARMRAELDAPLNEAQARQHFQRFAAFGRVAHARIDLDELGWAQYRADGGRAFPLSLRVQDDAAYVLDNFSGDPRLASGTRVFEIDAQPALAWLEGMGALVSADTPYLLHAQMEHQLPKLVWLQQGAVERFALKIENAQGDALLVDVPARSRDDFVAALQGPGSVFALDFNARSARMLDHDVAYLRPGPFYDNREDAASPWDPSAFKAFVDRAFEDFRAAGAQRLLIDLRDNPGGDNSFSDHLLAYVADRPFRFTEDFAIRASAHTRASIAARVSEDPDPQSVSARMLALLTDAADGSEVRFPIEATPPRDQDRFEGEVFVLINRHSYSNAVLVAAIVQDYGLGRVIGEETADLASTLGGMEHFQLPHSGIRVGYPKARMLRPSGDPTPRGVVPDWPIETPLQAGAEDVVLKRALARIEAEAERGTR
jgi:hypothetical protein